MTNIEHLMLTICFGINIGWILGGIMFIITETIKDIKEKHKIKKEQTKKNNERTGDNL